MAYKDVWTYLSREACKRGEWIVWFCFFWRFEEGFLGKKKPMVKSSSPSLPRRKSNTPVLPLCATSGSTPAHSLSPSPSSRIGVFEALRLAGHISKFHCSLGQIESEISLLASGMVASPTFHLALDKATGTLSLFHLALYTATSTPPLPFYLALNRASGNL